MPINLTTGLPGSGKTLSSLVRIKALAEKENRVVYYHGIKDLQLSWLPLDNPKKWFELPEGSIIVIDECQDLFPVHETKLAAENYVLELAKHRHRGYDIFLISQHPMNIHAFVRRLIDNHQHLIRAFGAKFANIHKWNRVIDYPEKTKKDSQTEIFVYPKDAYSYYKSAELHTIQRNIPKRLYWIILIPFLLAGLGYKAWSVLNPKHYKEQITGKPEGTVIANSNPQTKLLDKKQDWFLQQVPRIADLPHTAAKYDEITKPTIAPLPVACVASRIKCSCYTQQGTKYVTTDLVCRQIVKNGYFQDFNPNGKQEVASNNSGLFQSHNDGGIGGTQSPPMQAFAIPQDTIGLNSRSSPLNSR